MSSFKVTVIKEASCAKDLPGEIEIRAKNGKVSAKICPLQIASPILHNFFMESPDTKILDFADHKKKVIEGLLDLIHAGEITFTDESLKDKVVDLAKELEIRVQTVPTYKIIEGEFKAPEDRKVPIELIDPGLHKTECGKVLCKGCFKTFPDLHNARKHCRNVHFADKSQRNIPCQSPGCDKKFYLSAHMKNHMRKVHGISAKAFAEKSIPSFKVTMIKDASRIKHLPHDIEILADDGIIINAKRCPLQMASGIWNNRFIKGAERPILDLKTHKKEVIDCLLCLIYQGEMTFTEEEFKDEVVDLAQELEIQVKTEFMKMKTAATASTTKVPKKAPKLFANDDYCLMESGDGRFQCTICFKAFSTKSNGKIHYEGIHLTNRSVRNVQCRDPECDKKFPSKRRMEEHMRRCHRKYWEFLNSAK